MKIRQVLMCDQISCDLPPRDRFPSTRSAVLSFSSSSL